MLKQSVLESLLEKAELFGRFEKKAYILFSKSGFTKEVEEYVKEKNIMLVTLEEMYQEIK